LQPSWPRSSPRGPCAANHPRPHRRHDDVPRCYANSHRANYRPPASTAEALRTAVALHTSISPREEETRGACPPASTFGGRALPPPPVPAAAAAREARGSRVFGLGEVPSGTARASGPGGVLKTATTIADTWLYLPQKIGETCALELSTFPL
jgi:hypothetical protein